jgi:hypothetical protein
VWKTDADAKSASQELGCQLRVADAITAQHGVWSNKLSDAVSDAVARSSMECATALDAQKASADAAIGNLKVALKASHQELHLLREHLQAQLEGISASMAAAHEGFAAQMAGLQEVAALRERETAAKAATAAAKHWRMCLVSLVLGALNVVLILVLFHLLLSKNKPALVVSTVEPSSLDADSSTSTTAVLRSELASIQMSLASLTTASMMLTEAVMKNSNQNVPLKALEPPLSLVGTSASQELILTDEEWKGLISYAMAGESQGYSM